MLADHLDKLVPFTVIARTKSLRRAAETLGIAQPALTRTVRLLEAAVGAALFRRSVQGMELTQEGQVFLRFAESTLNRAADVKEQIRFAGDEAAGVLSIATYESLSIYLWPRLLAELQKTLPHLRIRLKTNVQGNAIDLLASGKFDLIVDAEPRPFPNMTSVTLYSDVFQFFADTQTKTIEDRPFIYVQAAFDQDDKSIADHLYAAGLRNPSLYELDSFEAAKALAQKGLGIAVLPERVAHDAVKSGTLRKFPVPGFSAGGFGKHRICVTYLASGRGDPRIKAAVRELKRLLAK